jgi:hypothetical protein
LKQEDALQTIFELITTLIAAHCEQHRHRKFISTVMLAPALTDVRKIQARDDFSLL